ncbi:MAG: hypothetical protein CMJ78_14880 [Planctomycetaceae bacterium]|nr:hypothetical protein [Planctomycetaceae bacterium]
MKYKSVCSVMLVLAIANSTRADLGLGLKNSLHTANVEDLFKAVYEGDVLAAGNQRFDAFFRKNNSQSLKDYAFLSVTWKVTRRGKSEDVKRSSPEIKLLQYLAKLGANPNASGGFSKAAPLLIASELGTPKSLDLIGVLLELGADPNQKDAFGKSPIAVTRSKEAKAIIQAALDARK